MNLISQGMKNRHQNKEKKPKKQKQNYSKWTKHEEKIYWISIIQFVIKNKKITLSWKNVKPDGLFPFIQQCFQSKKTTRQLKSFDQNMKKKYLIKLNINFEDAIEAALKEFPLSDQQEAILQKYRKIREQNVLNYVTFNRLLDEEIQQNAQDHQQLKFILQICKKSETQLDIFF